MFVYRTIIVLFIMILNTYSLKSHSQNTILKRVEPTNWWVGMKDPHLQLMVYGESISSFDIKIKYKGVSVEKINKAENPNYLFIDLVVSEGTQPGVIPIHFIKDNKKAFTYEYQLLERAENSANREGFNSGDAMYLVMPDRFANGNPANDNVEGMLEKANRRLGYGRHGGDLKGIHDYLDFIEEMGYTAIWLNPVMENNQPKASYHGYAITDFYKIDARLGTNEEFKALTKECNNRGIKMIMDMVFNHCGSYHWWMDDLPMHNWINQWEEFTRSNYRLSTISDPYVSEYDKGLSVKGWFDTTMPDLNLENDYMLTYMIQNSVWWIEYAGLRGIRMLCYWQKDFPNQDGYNSHLPSLMDFPMQSAISKAFCEEEGWDTGLSRLYNTIADDHLYPNPLNMVVFPDNHDEGRILYKLNNDTCKLKMALTYAATIRGILQIYYGTELLMNGNGHKGHDKIRKDFPGGWPNDTINAFTKEGRTPDQNKIFTLIKKLLNYRKQSEALKYGKTLHFIPEKGIYVYFRHTDNEAIMVVLNNNNKGVRQVDTKRFNEILSKYKTGKNIITQRTINSLNTINIKAKSALVIELQ
jgi:glycosidase